MKQTPQSQFEQVLQNANPEQIQGFLQGKELTPNWLQFSQGVYSFPLTWWVGILHITMLGGVWGQEHKTKAHLRQSQLHQLLMRLFNDPDIEQRILFVLKYIKKYYPMYLTGRGVGAFFTGQAQRLRVKLPLAVSLPQAVTNLALASYGGAILCVGQGGSRVEDIIFASIVGRNHHMLPMPNRATQAQREEGEQKYPVQVTKQHLESIQQLNQVNMAKPIAIEKFCQDPRNADLRNTVVCQP